MKDELLNISLHGVQGFQEQSAARWHCTSQHESMGSEAWLEISIL